MLAGGPEVPGGAAVLVRDLRPWAAVPWCRYPANDLGYLVLQGRMRFAMPGRDRLVDGLSFVPCPRGTAHRWTAHTPVRLLVLVAPAGGVERFLLHADRCAADDPALLLELAQEHGVELLPDLLP